MSDYTPTQIQGLVIPEARLQSLSLADCTYTEAGPRVGVPEPSQTTSAVLHTTGTQSTGGIVRVRTQAPGHPGDFGASFLWRVGVSETYRGWDPPWILRGFEWVDRSTTVNAWNHPYMVTLQDDTLLCSAVADLRYVKVWKRTVGGSWSSTTVYDHGSAMSASANPCMVLLPSGRVMLYHWVEYSTYYGLRAWYSDDDGSTWTLAAKQAIRDTSVPVVSTNTPKRLRAAYASGCVCLVAWVTTATDDAIWQWSSTDAGAGFSLVDVYDDSDAGYPDVLSDGDGFLVGWLQSSGGAVSATYVPHLVKLGSSATPITGTAVVYGQGSTQTYEWAAVSGGVLSDGDFSMLRDDDGAIYLFGRRASGTGQNTGIVSRSTDAGASFFASSGPVDLADTADTLRNFAAGRQGGAIYIMSQNVASPATGDDSLSLIRCGGYDSEPMPLGDGMAHTPTNVSNWDGMWVPINEPDFLGTFTASGTGVSTLTSAGLQIVTTADNRWYEVTPTIDLNDGAVFEGECDVTSGNASVEMRCSDATPLLYSIRAFVTTTAVTLYDNIAAANVGTVAINASTSVQIRCVQVGASATLWYRFKGTSLWTEVATTTTLTSSATNPGGRIRFGSDTGTGTVVWRWAGYSTGGSKVPTLLTRPSGDKLGRYYTGAATGTYIADGVRLVADRGPTLTGDIWVITATADYGVDRLIPTGLDNSPRRVWRSTTDASNVDFVIDPDGGIDTDLMTPMLAVYIMGANFPTATLSGEVAGVYSTLATLDLRLQTSLKFTRAGSVINVDTSGGSAVTHYLRRNMLAGARFRLDATTIRTITANADGVWRASASYAPTRLVLDGVQGGDPAAGTGGAIWMPNGLFLVPLTQQYEKFRLRIPTATTAEGYFQCRVMFGSVYVWGMNPSWDHAIEHSWVTEVTERTNGMRSMRSLAPARTSLEVSWPDGVNVEAIQKASPPAPDRVLTYTGATTAIASRMDIPYSVPGLIDELEGATSPVVVIRGIDYPASSAMIPILNPDHYLYGHVVTDTLRIDNVLGHPTKSELMRVGTVRVDGLT